MVTFNAIQIGDGSLIGLEYLRDKFNAEQKANLTTEEFIGITLENWARHAQTKRVKDAAREMVAIYEVSSPEDQAELVRILNEFRDKAGGTLPNDRGEGIQALQTRSAPRTVSARKGSPI